MSGGEDQCDGPPPDADRTDPRDTARDWITIVESEFAAMATDREAQEQMIRLASLWASTAQTALDWLPGLAPKSAREQPGGRAGSGTASGAPPAAAAPDARDAAIERLARRVEELERLIARLERPSSDP